MTAYFPELIQIETTTACNASCKMCPRDIQLRGHGTMPDDTFYCVVGQAYDLGIRMMVPFINGEPLADRRMVGFIRHIRNSYKDVEVVLYTNASLLTEEKAIDLLSIGNIRHFNVSLQGGTKEAYESNMGLNWETTINNVDRLIDVNASLGCPAEIRVNMCVFSKTADTLSQFVDRWSSKATVCPGEFSNFGGMVSDTVEDRWATKPRMVCDRATKHIYVYWNGDVGQCCFDLLGSIVYGNVNNQTLRDIVSSEKHMSMRRAHHAVDTSGMPPICINCNSCKFKG